MKENLEKIYKDLTDNVKLIAVSKTKPASLIEEAYDLGIRDFGENKVQELCEKESVLPSDINWHFIGHLQTNKVKQLLKTNVYLIHSVDSYKLARQIDNEAKKLNKVINILIEINIAGEESKFGIEKQELTSLVDEISKLENVKIKGLMTVAPYTPNPEENNKYFILMRKLFDEFNSNGYDFDTLSMGMSNDYKQAIASGSTMVRIGEKIFGKRIYKK